MKHNKNAKPLTDIGGHARQGDVLLRRIEKIDKSGQKKLKTCTLALGEVTGHHHTMEKGAVGYTDGNENLASSIEVEEAVSALKHQEHDPIKFPKGSYEKLQQVEYTPKEIRRVLD